jgi:hypothetical protein
MPRPAPLQSLDQNDDPLGSSYDHTVRLYDQYQGLEYGENYERRKAAWEAHYQRMRAATEQFLWRFTERHKRREETVMAVCGPGLDPGRRDFDTRLIESGLSQLRGIILVDFSRMTNASAARSLIGAGVDANRLHRVQFDLTGRMSTMYLRHLEERLRDVNTEEELADAVSRLEGEDTVGVLRSRLFDEVTQAGTEAVQGKVTADTRSRLQALINPKHSLRLTSQDKPVQVDLFSLNMILAGTGAAAEGLVWDKYQNALMTDAEQPVSESTLRRRRKILRDMHAVITRYNTDVAKEMFRTILDTNPNARVLAMTDVSTIYRDEDLDVGRLPRLDVEQMRLDLEELGIDVTLSKPIPNWAWEDEPEHSHEVVALTAKRSATDAIVGLS